MNASAPVITQSPATSLAARTPSPRIHGIDLARFLAVIGMAFSHLGPYLDQEYLNWVIEARDGLPSALFAVLAGVSMSLMGASAARHGGAELAHSRHRLIMRGLLLVVLGFILAEVQISIAVVLETLGMAMILLSWTPRARTSTLISLALTLLLVGPALQVILPGTFANSLVLGGTYPIFAWLTYVTVGVLIHRLLVTRSNSMVLLPVFTLIGAVGTFLGLNARGVIGILPENSSGAVQYSTEPLPELAPVLFSERSFVFLSPVGHSGGLLDQLTCIFGAIFVISLSLLLCRSQRLVTVLYPLRAAGSMGLTVYVIHVISASMVYGGFLFGMTNPNDTWDMYQEQLPESTTLAFWVTLVVAIIACSLWKLKFRRGPLEEGMNRAINATTRRDLPAR
ncbi:DUF418 domain-containing protein [Corynebacterium sp. A21]|uniref:DUF418 domain-containing protein n=1 Tax=Corynebacterium sp. A21 TaxID=3457318 RepID=UPI003FD3C9DC